MRGRASMIVTSAAEALEDRSKLDPDRTGADDDHRLRHGGDREDFHVGHDGVVRPCSRAACARLNPWRGQPSYAFTSPGFCLPSKFSACASLGWPMSSLVTLMVKTPSFAPPVSRPCPLNHGDLVLLHQEVETLGMLRWSRHSCACHAGPVPVQLRIASTSMSIP